MTQAPPPPPSPNGQTPEKQPCAQQSLFGIRRGRVTRRVVQRRAQRSAAQQAVVNENLVYLLLEGFLSRLATVDQFNGALVRLLEALLSANQAKKRKSVSMSAAACLSSRFGTASPERDDRRVLPMETDDDGADLAAPRQHPQIVRVKSEWSASVDELVAECERQRLMVRAYGRTLGRLRTATSCGACAQPREDASRRRYTVWFGTRHAFTVHVHINIGNIHNAYLYIFLVFASKTQNAKQNNVSGYMEMV